MVPNEIPASARILVEAWLLPGKSAELELARRAYSTLLKQSSSGTIHSLRKRINRIADAALRNLDRMASELDDDRHLYTVSHQDREGDFTLTGTFGETYGIYPKDALKNLLTIRQSAPLEQLSSLRTFLSDYALERANEEVASSNMTPAHIDYLMQLHEGNRLPVRISVREPDAVSLNFASLKALQEKAAHSAKGKVAALSRKNVPQQHTLTQSKLVALCHAVCEALQRIAVRRVPIAIVLPEHLTSEDCISIAAGYFELADCLRIKFPSAIDGERSGKTHLIIVKLIRNSHILRVVASWISAFAAPEKQTRCQLCYRHKAARKRCAEHSVPTHITPAARKAAAVYPLFLEANTRLAAISNATAIPATISDGERTAIEDEARSAGVPEVLVPNAAFLAYQLRGVVAFCGSELAEELASCFQAQLNSAAEALVAPLGRTLSALNTAELARQRAKDLMTLHGFLIVWFAAGKPFPKSFPRLIGRSHDPAHPYLRGASLSLIGALAEFRLASAWYQAIREFDRETSIDSHEALSLLKKGWSYDRVAAHFGCSHDTIFRIARNSPSKEGRSRSRLKKYTARSRLLPSSKFLR